MGVNVLHGGHHDAEKYNPTILFVVVFILVSSSIADNTFVDDKNFKNNDELKKDISTFFFGNNDENCHIDSYKQEYQLVVKDGEI